MVQLDTRELTILQRIHDNTELNLCFDAGQLDPIYEHFVKNHIGEVEYLTEALIKLNIDPLEHVSTVYPRMYSCSSIRSICIPEGLKLIGAQAFTACRYLEEVEIKDGITCIDDNAFEFCTSLKKIIIPNSVIEIGSDIFDECISLQDVKFGKGLKYIKDAYKLFVGCEKLKSIQYVGTKKQFNSLIRASKLGSKSLKGFNFGRSITVRCSDGGIEFNAPAFENIDII